MGNLEIKGYVSYIVKKLKAPGGLLIFSGLISKFLGLLRDRVFTHYYADSGELDWLLAAFKIPDFFFFLLISGTVGTLLLPRAEKLNEEKDKQAFILSFLWGVGMLFGVVAFFGAIFAPYLVRGMLPGFAPDAYAAIIPLLRYLFIAVWLLAVSSVLVSALQSRKSFYALAFGPIIWTLCIIIFVGLWGEKGIWVAGAGEIFGGILHIGLSMTLWKRMGGRFSFAWFTPPRAFSKFWSDFFYRVMNTGVVQLIHLADVFIASFLAVGAVASFTFGSALGGLLMTIIGISLANAVFPTLTEHKNNYRVQSLTVKKTALAILALSIPYSILAFIFADEFINLVYAIDGQMAKNAASVLRWTVVSLPLSCLIPLFIRWLLANDQVKKPTMFAAIAAVLSISIAAYLSLQYLPSETAVVGLGVGNFVTNVTMCGLLLASAYRQRNQPASK